MENMTYSEFRNNLASALDRVNEDHTPILVTRQSGKPAIVLSFEDYKSYEETAYLMSSRNNCDRINESIAELEAGCGKKKDLIDE